MVLVFGLDLIPGSLPEIEHIGKIDLQGPERILTGREPDQILDPQIYCPIQRGIHIPDESTGPKLPAAFDSHDLVPVTRAPIGAGQYYQHEER